MVYIVVFVGRESSKHCWCKPENPKGKNWTSAKERESDKHSWVELQAWLWPKLQERLYDNTICRGYRFGMWCNCSCLSPWFSYHLPSLPPSLYVHMISLIKKPLWIDYSYFFGFRGKITYNNVFILNLYLMHYIYVV